MFVIEWNISSDILNCNTNVLIYCICTTCNTCISHLHVQPWNLLDIPTSKVLSHYLCNLSHFLETDFICGSVHCRDFNAKRCNQIMNKEKIVTKKWHTGCSWRTVQNSRKANLFMKQGSLFCFVLSCWDLPNHSTSWHTLGTFRKFSVSRVYWTWFETVWSYGVKAIDYWTISSMKTK
jgi:hypothetical protein